MGNDMKWCRNCGMAVNTSECFTDEEDITYCPVCHHEVDEANRCACGMWKASDADWCDDCLDAADKAMQTAFCNIRLKRHVHLDRENVLALMAGWLDI